VTDIAATALSTDGLKTLIQQRGILADQGLTGLDIDELHVFLVNMAWTFNRWRAETATGTSSYKMSTVGPVPMQDWERNEFAAVFGIWIPDKLFAKVPSGELGCFDWVPDFVDQPDSARPGILISWHMDEEFIAPAQTQFWSAKLNFGVRENVIPNKWAAKYRVLAEWGATVKQIVLITGKPYQHVYNTLKGGK
jgi:hypothetical protein